MSIHGLDPSVLISAAAAARVADRRLGGNSTVTRVRWGGADLALKDASARSDAPVRVAREWQALTFLWSRTPGLAPKPVGANTEAGLIVSEWVAGTHPQGRSALRSMLDILLTLHRLAEEGPPSPVGPATDAIATRQDLVRQVRDRATVLSRHPAVAREAGDLVLAVQGLALYDGEFGGPALTLSPSDFGPHNILVDPNTARIIDLEFFGWDDAHKLVADTLLHPQVDWGTIDRDAFLEKVTSLYRLNMLRLHAIGQLCGLKWSAIALGRASREADSGNAAGAEHALSLARRYMDDALVCRLGDPRSD